MNFKETSQKKKTMIKMLTKSFRQTLEDDAASIDMNTEAGWSIIDEVIDETSHPTASNDKAASGLAFHDETFVKTSDWLRICAHLDYELLDAYQASRISAKSANPSELEFIEGCLDQETAAQADENTSGGNQPISSCYELVELNNQCTDSLGQTHSASHSCHSDSAMSQELGILENPRYVDNDNTARVASPSSERYDEANVRPDSA